jgi:Protein of unknown function (DUF1348)
MAATIDALKAPDSKLAREIAELVRDTETPLLFHHSSRVYHWGALTGRRPSLRPAYTLDSRWRNRAEFLQGREAIEAFLTHKWNRELDYRLTGDAA